MLQRKKSPEDKLSGCASDRPGDFLSRNAVAKLDVCRPYTAMLFVPRVFSIISFSFIILGTSYASECKSAHNGLIKLRRSNCLEAMANSLSWVFLFNILVYSNSTCRAHAFWLCRACWTARLDTLDMSFDWLDTLVSTRSTRRMCHVVSRRDATSQVEFGLDYVF